MGFLNKKPIIKAEGFHPLELNEDNVRAIFHRCIPKGETPEDQCCNSILFSRTTGFSGGDVKIIYFDIDKLLVNKKNIEYLQIN